MLFYFFVIDGYAIFLFFHFIFAKLCFSFFIIKLLLFSSVWNIIIIILISFEIFLSQVTVWLSIVIQIFIYFLPIIFTLWFASNKAMIYIINSIAELGLTLLKCLLFALTVMYLNLWIFRTVISYQIFYFSNLFFMIVMCYIFLFLEWEVTILYFFITLLNLMKVHYYF